MNKITITYDVAELGDKGSSRIYKALITNGFTPQGAINHRENGKIIGKSEFIYYEARSTPTRDQLESILNGLTIKEIKVERGVKIQ